MMRKEHLEKRNRKVEKERQKKRAKDILEKRYWNERRKKKKEKERK